MNWRQKIANPLLMKELMERMRSKKTPWLLVGYLLVMGGITLAYIYLETRGQGYFNPQRSRTLFITLTTLQLAMVAFVTPGLTAGTISGERERQTLNILLTTHLSPMLIVSSKLISAISFITLLVLAALPLYAITFLYGGISPGQLGKVLGFYVVTMVSFGGLGVMYSTIFKRTGVATAMTYGTLFGIGAAATVLAELGPRFYYMMNPPTPGQPPPPLPDFLQYLHGINPVTAIVGLFNEEFFRGRPGQISIDPFYVYVIFWGVLAVLALMAAMYWLKPVRRLFPWPRRG